MVDSGLMRFEVLDIDATHVRCKALTAGKLGSRRHVNLPGMTVNLPSLTEKDERDLRAGVEAGIDFVALSFVRKSDDILLLRDFLDSLGSRARIIAKIEDQRRWVSDFEAAFLAEALAVSLLDLFPT